MLKKFFVMMFLITTCIGFAAVVGQKTYTKSGLQARMNASRNDWIAIQLDSDKFYTCNYGGSDFESIAKKCISLSGKSSGIIITASGSPVEKGLKSLFSSAGSGPLSGTNAYRF